MNKNNKIHELMTRGVAEAIDQKHLESVLVSGKKLRVKLGIDPTSPNIHIGRAIVLWKLRAFQDLGHTAIFIVGDFTGLIGDTSDKDAERPMLTQDQVKDNMRTYLEQAFKILDSKKTEVEYNSTWLSKLGFHEIGRIANLFGLHEFIMRPAIARRIKDGKRVSLREVLYPLMQGYDSVAVKADVELGGTDQRFNLLAGRTIQPAYNQEPQNVFMMELLAGTDGLKMSSSSGNVINIADKPDDMFGKIMSINDDLVVKYFNLGTRVSLENIENIKKRLNEGVNPRDIKAELAFEIVSLYHGNRAANKAREEFKKVFSDKELPSDRPEIKSQGNIVMSMWVAGIASKTEAKKLIDQGAVILNGKKVDSWNTSDKPGDDLKVGSRRFFKIK